MCIDNSLKGRQYIQIDEDNVGSSKPSIDEVLSDGMYMPTRTY